MFSVVFSDSISLRVTCTLFVSPVVDFLDAGQNMVPEPANETEKARQGESASLRKRKRRQRDLAEYEREFARWVSGSDGRTATSGR